MPFGAGVELVGKLCCVVLDPGQKQGFNLSLLISCPGWYLSLGQQVVGPRPLTRSKSVCERVVETRWTFKPTCPKEAGDPLLMACSSELLHSPCPQNEIVPAAGGESWRRFRSLSQSNGGGGGAKQVTSQRTGNGSLVGHYPTTFLKE